MEQTSSDCGKLAYDSRPYRECRFKSRGTTLPLPSDEHSNIPSHETVSDVHSLSLERRVINPVLLTSLIKILVGS